MIRIFKCHSRLVPGVVSGPKPEIVVGRSTFYPDAFDQLSAPIQETGSQDVLDSLEQSKTSVTSEDVAQASSSKFKGNKTTQPSTQICKPYAQAKHKAICAKASYVPVGSKNVKILVVGDKGAGKTSIIQYTTSDEESNPFCCHYRTTSLPSCSGKLVEHYGELYIINFWELIDDTHFCEEHHEYYTGAMGAFVVCESSKINVPSILLYKKKINNIVCQRNGDPIPVYLLVSKCDIKHEARGSQNDSAMAKLVEENGFAGYFKTSAKTGEGIEEAVRAAQKEILRDTFPHPPRVCETPDELKK